MESSKMMKDTDLDLMRLYELTIQEWQFMIERMERKLEFFWKIISVIFGGVVIGLFNATKPYHYIILNAAPFLMIYISWTAQHALSRDYLAFLEKITKLAKIETAMGLDSFRIDKGSWTGETIIPNRYIESRKKFSSSEEFINHHMNHGLLSIYMRMLEAVKIISAILVLMLLFLSYKTTIK